MNRLLLILISILFCGLVYLAYKLDASGEPFEIPRPMPARRY